MFKQTVAVLALFAVAPVYADDIDCTGSIGATTVDGNVIVPSNQSCTLTGTYVKGNVELEDGAKLLARGSTYIEGSVQTDGADRVRIRDSEVNGDVQLTGVDGSISSFVLSSVIGGTVEWEDNSAAFLIRFSDVNGDVKVNQNSAQARVFDNVVDGNLQCQANEPAPVGARNVVGGNKEDQCAGF
ncbi:MAG: hypothetical protein HC808_02780 [Candidatus Competibacteraceae bacterium]|nr:hypothetical protein [Candidatus Competibacteraceae bacterium]